MRWLVVVLVACGARHIDPPPRADVVIHARRIVDVVAGAYISERLIAIRGDRIAAIEPWDPKRIAAGARVIELATVLPGLIDAHVHLAWGAADRDRPAGADDAALTLRAGFTTVRNLGSTAGADLALRDAIAAGTVLGPRMLAAGAALGAPGGVCDAVFAGEAKVTTAADATREVDRLAAAGADVIKVCAGGGVVPSAADATAVELPEDVLRAIVVAATRHGLKVAAHAQGGAAIASAARAGVASIEHGALIDAAAGRTLRERGVVLVPTLARLDFLAEGAPAERKDAAIAARDEARARVAAAVRAGVAVVLGTDATVLPHGTNAREFGELVRAGLTPAAALRAATVDAARLLGPRAGEVGVLAAGALADVIAVDGDPLADVEALRHVVFVMKGGAVVPSVDRGGR